MDRFRYRAVNGRGRQVRGTLAAANEQDLYRQLQAGGLELIACRPDRTALFGLFEPRVPARDLIELFIELEQLQRAGVPLLTSLEDIRESVASGRLRDVVSELARDVSEGYSLSAAIERHPRVFGPVFRSLISAGEDTGDYADAFGQLVRYLSWVEEMRGRLRKALRYPAVLTVVVLLVIVFMMSFVVPQVVTMLEAIGSELPAPTRALIATSEAVRTAWPFALAAVVAVTLLVRFGSRLSEGMATRRDGALLRLPGIGPLLRKLALARFAHTFAVMYGSGIGVLTALEAAGRTVENRVLHAALEQVMEGVRNGRQLAEAMRASGEFPPLVVRMVHVGEQSGTLGEVLTQVAAFYDRDVDDQIDRVIGMIEPVLTAVLGGVIAWIAVSVFGPVYDSLGQLAF